MSDGSIQVWRPAPEDAAEEALRHRGASGLTDALRGLAGPLAGATEIHAKLKIIRVELAATRATTQAIYSLSGRVAGGSLEQHATWQAEWLREPDRPPVLSSLRVLGDFEETLFRGDRAATQFRDLTAGVLGRNGSFASQLMRGT